jgi:hypothetical protein
MSGQIARVQLQHLHAEAQTQILLDMALDSIDHVVCCQTCPKCRWLTRVRNYCKGSAQLRSETFDIVRDLPPSHAMYF